MRFAVFILTLCGWLQSAQGDPLQQLQLVGNGQMRWAFFTLYDAELYSNDGQYREGQYPLALALTYRRDISAKHLLSATEDQWRELNIHYTHEWLKQLTQIWPDVGDSDCLTFIAQDRNVGQFIFNGQLIGNIEGDDFAHAFLAIWLSPQTSQQALRKRLIGDSNV